MLFDKEKQALKKIKSLQRFLNKHFPDTELMESMSDFKFTEAEDFLAEEARRWQEAKKINREGN